MPTPKSHLHLDFDGQPLPGESVIHSEDFNLSLTATGKSLPFLKPFSKTKVHMNSNCTFCLPQFAKSHDADLQCLRLSLRFLTTLAVVFMLSTSLFSLLLKANRASFSATSNESALQLALNEITDKTDAAVLIKLRSGLASEGFDKEVQTPVDFTKENINRKTLQAQEARFLVKLSQAKFSLF